MWIASRTLTSFSLYSTFIIHEIVPENLQNYSMLPLRSNVLMQISTQHHTYVVVNVFHLAYCDFSLLVQLQCDISVQPSCLPSIYTLIVTKVFIKATWLDPLLLYHNHDEIRLQTRNLVSLLCFTPIQFKSGA